MKAIILGAGNATRLAGAIPEGMPKWMAQVGGLSWAQHLVNAFHGAGIEQVYLVRGRLKQTVQSPSVRYIDLAPTRNMVETFLSVRDLFDDDVIVCYGDILIEPKVLQSLIESDEEVSVVIDNSWKDFFELRGAEGLKDAESCVIESGALRSVGQALQAGEMPEGQYIGLMKWSRRALARLVELYQSLHQQFRGRPWRNAPSFEAAYMTDLLQEMIDQGWHLEPVRIEHGWIELDRPADLEIARALKSGKFTSTVFDFSQLPSRPTVLSAGGVALRRQNGLTQILLVGSGRSGEWRIPKGMLEPGETCESAAVREVQEETGTPIHLLGRISHLEWVYSYGGIEWTEICQFYLMAPDADVAPQPDSEHAVADWISVDDAKSGMMYENERGIVEAALRMGVVS